MEHFCAAKQNKNKGTKKIQNKSAKVVTKRTAVVAPKKTKISKSPKFNGIDASIRKVCEGVTHPMAMKRLPSDAPSAMTGLNAWTWEFNLTSKSNEYFGVRVQPGPRHTLGVLDQHEGDSLFNGDTWPVLLDEVSGYQVSQNFPFANDDFVVNPNLKKEASGYYRDEAGNIKPGYVWAYDTDQLRFDDSETALQVALNPKTGYATNVFLRIFTNTGGTIASTTILSDLEMTGYTSALISGATFTSLKSAVNGSDYWWITAVCDADAFEAEIFGSNVEVTLSATFINESGVGWKFYDFGQIINSDGSYTNGPVYNAVQDALTSYQAHRVNSMFTVLSDTSKGDASGGTLSAVTVASKTIVGDVSDGASLMNAIAQYPGPKPRHSDAASGLSAAYLRDSEEQWEFRLNEYRYISATNAFAVAEKIYYPTVFMSLKAAQIPNAVGYYRFQFKGTIGLCMEFKGKSVMYKMVRPLPGLIDYKRVYATFVSEYGQYLHENPNHVKKFVDAITKMSQNPHLRQAAAAALEIGKAAAPLVKTAVKLAAS